MHKHIERVSLIAIKQVWYSLSRNWLFANKKFIMQFCCIVIFRINRRYTIVVGFVKIWHALYWEWWKKDRRFRSSRVIHLAFGFYLKILHLVIRWIFRCFPETPVCPAGMAKNKFIGVIINCIVSMSRRRKIDIRPSILRCNSYCENVTMVINFYGAVWSNDSPISRVT